MSGPSGGAGKGVGKDADVVSLRASRPCPICGKPSVRAFYPFDTKRCADIDLHRWLSGAYAIPAEEAEQPADNKSAQTPGSGE